MRWAEAQRPEASLSRTRILQTPPTVQEPQVSSPGYQMTATPWEMQLRSVCLVENTKVIDALACSKELLINTPSTL